MSDNFDSRESAGTLVGSVVIAVWKAERYLKTTVSAILAFILAAGGTFTGSTTFASLSYTLQEITATAASAILKSFVQLNHASTKIEATLASLAQGKIHIITQTDAGTEGHTVTLAIGTFDGTNNTATFNAAGETLVVIGLDGTDGLILQNIGSVELSSVP